MRSCWLRVGPKSSRRGEEEKRRGGEVAVKMEAEIRVRRLQAKEHQGSQPATRSQGAERQGTISPQNLQMEPIQLITLTVDSWPSDL